jgi:hypothetical protein
MDHNMVFSYNYGKQKRGGKNKCTFIAGHFDCHASKLEQYKWHHPMQHVQGYLRSHWMPQLGDYSLRIAPVAARATANKTTMKTYTYFAGRVDGHSDAPLPYHMHCPMEEVQGFTRSH